ncbi:MAG: S8 family serine peptidase, partial [Okeania sp. SIO2D1]|nr:S8 family serine peptidase [Okeania sp. SIO2D1]
ATLPVLMRQDVVANTPEAEQIVVLPNEITLSFASGTSETERAAILAENNLAIIRKLRFTKNRYLVRSLSASGIEVLNVANQLNGVAKIESATPNFMQTLTKQQKVPSTDWTAKANLSDHKILPMHWHLNSSFLKGCLDRRDNDSQPLTEYLQKCFEDSPLPQKANSQFRTDIRATEAWKNSQGGKGVVVAVMDSLIQWDHPDLINNIHQVDQVSDKLPGEVRGWDFVEDDPDPAISREELTVIAPRFRDAFLLSDLQLRQKYPQIVAEIQEQYADYSPREVVKSLRWRLSNRVAQEFHGTMVAGVVAAKPQQELGVIGVAPEAKILPVRVIGVNGSFSLANYLEAIGYAAARNVDIINFSLGSRLPSEAEVEVISEVLESNPELVIVASAGNHNEGAILFPAGIPGVIAVGATNIYGYRASYSNYGVNEAFGQKLTLVAPGGDNTTPRPVGRILTTGGTWLEAFWQGIQEPGEWGDNLDSKGMYRWTQGTSFSTPAVAGAIALMKGEDRDRRLSREQIAQILQETATYQGLNLTENELNIYKERSPSLAKSARQYFFGSGLVNADAAVREVKNLP